MRTKPKHLSPSYAAQFQDVSVVSAYVHRPPYPPETFALLGDLLAPGSRALLDIGCGMGQIARGMLPLCDKVDALDWSAAMIASGRQLPGGDDERLHWICGRAEDAPLHPPYALVTAGASIHWMDWDVLLPRLRAALVPGGFVALVSIEGQPTAWGDALGELCARFSTNRDYQPYDIVDELQQRDLFHPCGTAQTAWVPFAQSVDDYIESFHSANGFSRERMTSSAAAAFDAHLRALVTAHANNGLLHFTVSTQVVWGLPSP